MRTGNWRFTQDMIVLGACDKQQKVQAGVASLCAEEYSNPTKTEHGMK
jgi:hypothetical protein